MENNSKKRKDALNASASSRSSRAGSSTATNVTSRASESLASEGSISSLSQSEVVYNSNLLSSSEQDVMGGYNLRAHLQQIMQFSDDMESSSDEYSVESFDDDDGADAELQKIVGREQGEGRGNVTPKPTNQSCNALVPVEEEDELDSEEENAIMKEIKEEIKNNVRQEMQSELEVYKKKTEYLEKGMGEGAEEKTNADLEQLDPKLKEAFIKMRKLDKILSKRVRREKEVKRDRILLERRIRQELKDLHAEGKQEQKEIESNEQKFLALELPSRHNQGVLVPDEVTGEQVFATQLDEDDYPGINNNTSRARRQGTRSNRAESRGSSKMGTEDSGSTRDDASSVASGSVEGKKHRKKRKKDFIKRNKELASDAANVIAMTEEEKKRLDELLKDVDNIPDIPEGQEDVEDESNPFQIVVLPGEGFHPDADEMRSMTSIDARLKEIMPPEDYQSVAYSSLSHVPKNKLFTRTAVRSDIDWENHGERALFQNAEQRDMNERLRAIEEELNKLHNPEEIEIETPRLDDDQLHDLIDQCVDSLSRASLSRTSFNTDSRYSFADTESLVGGSQSIDGTTDNTPRTPASVRQELLDNSPRLAPEVLQKLLSEAYNPLSKQLSTLREEDCEDDDGTPIPADVWKLISMEKVEDSVDPSDNTETGRDSKQNTSSRQNQYDEIQKPSSRQNSYENFQNPPIARNGYKSLSRDSSSSSLNGAIIDNGRDSKPLKLPEIDPTGTLITQGLNNQRPPSNNQRPGSSNSSVKTPINMLRNSLGDNKMDNSQPNSRMEIMSFDGEFMSPRPPSGEKRETGSANKSRTVTPASRPVT